MSQPTYNHNLQHDITQLQPGESVLDAFPELLAYPVLAEHGAGDGDKVLRFALFFASKGSGLLHLEPGRKKEEALRLAGIGEDDARYADILAWRNRAAVLLANQVIRLHNDLDYAVWWHTGLGLYSSAEKVSALIDTDDLPPFPLPPLPEPEGTPEEQLKKAMEDFKSAPMIVRPTSNMGEDKVMRTYTLKHKLIDDLNRQRKDYKLLTDELFMSDEDLAKASERERLAGAGAVGQRAQKETFIAQKRTIK